MSDTETDEAVAILQRDIKRPLARGALPPARCGARCRRTGQPCRRYPITGKARCGQHGGLTPSLTPERRARTGEATQAAWARHTPQERASRIDAMKRGVRLAKFRRALSRPNTVRRKTTTFEDHWPMCTAPADCESAACLDGPKRRRRFNAALFGFDVWGGPIAAEQLQLDVVARCLVQGRTSEDTARLLAVGGHRRRGRRWSGRHVRSVWVRWRREGGRRESYAIAEPSGLGEQACAACTTWCEETTAIDWTSIDQNTR